MEEKSYKEYLENITTFILDVDGVLTNGSLLITSKGDMLRTMNVKDGYAIKTAVTKGYNFCIISGGSNPGVGKRLEGLGVKEIHLGVHHKVATLEAYLEKHQIKAEQALYMGDDIPDAQVMKMVGMPCCPNDAVAEIKAVSKYISHKKGGEGCVRDVIEQVLKVQGKWMDNFDAQYD